MENDRKNILTVLGGSFKPPTQGHFNMVKWALEQYPETEEIIIYVGGGKRGKIHQNHSILVWDIYKKYLSPKLNIIPVGAPIKQIVKLAHELPDTQINMVIGCRVGNKKDLMDVKRRTKHLPKNVKIRIHSSDDVYSGRRARKALLNSEKALKEMIPQELNQTEVAEIFKILNDKTPTQIDNKIWI